MLNIIFEINLKKTFLDSNITRRVSGNNNLEESLLIHECIVKEMDFNNTSDGFEK